MANMVQLVAAGSATTNPAPSTLSPVSPYANASADRKSPQSSWTTQAKPALISRNSGVELTGNANRIDFNPSTAGATYTVTFWVFNRLTATWYAAQGNASGTYTGAVSLSLINASNDAWFIQLSSISAGTVQISYDARFLQAI
jgi:hypothetical protein